MAHLRHLHARARTAITVAVMIGSALCAGVPAAYAGSDSEDAVADLRHRAAVLDYQVLDLSRRLRYAQDSFDSITRVQDATREQLTARLIARYQSGDLSSPATLVLGSRSVGDAISVLRISRDLTGYEARMLRQLDATADDLLLERQQASRLEREMVATQQRADALRQRASRLEARRIARLDRARRKRARAKAARSQLVAGVGLDPLAGMSTTTAFVGALPPAGLVPASSVTAESIDAYLYSKRSPMAGQGTFIVASGQRWGVDPRLIVAIAGAESSFGQQLCGGFNAWGWSCPGSPAQFGSWALGIETIAQGLRNYYLDEGRSTVALIQQKWAPSGASNDPTGLNNYWVANVSRFLVELGGDPNSLSMGSSLGNSALDAVSSLSGS